MSESSYLGHRARARLFSLGGRSPSYQDVAGDEAENLRERLLSGPTVDIFVGHERKQWSLHRNLLCHHSTYFETELHGQNGDSKNALRDNKLELPDDDPVGFELLVKWLYQGQLEDASQMSDEAKYEYAVACHKLYLLCDKFDMVRLKNIAMDQYRQCLNEAQLVPDAEEIDDIYRASPGGSPFRSLMIKIAARQIMDPDADRDAESYRKCFENNPDFAVEMVNAIRYMSGGILFEDPTFAHQCAYHDHNDVSGCQVEGKGKGRASKQAKAGAINGQGHSAANRRQQYRSISGLAELPAEKRTPRKLRTPSSSPTAAKIVPPSPHSRRTTPNSRAQAQTANKSIPRQPLPQTNGPPSQQSQSHGAAEIAAKGRATSNKTKHAPVHQLKHSPQAPKQVMTGPNGSPFDETETFRSRQSTKQLQINVPAANGVLRGPQQESPLMVKDGNRRTANKSNETTGNSSLRSSTTEKENNPPNGYTGEGGRQALTAERVKRIPFRPRTRPRSVALRSTAGTDASNQSTASSGSRKRKMEDRASHASSRFTAPVNDGTSSGIKTPISGTWSVQRPGYTRSSTGRSTIGTNSGSVASGGPRKLSRISSVQKRYNAANGTVHVIDSRYHTRPRNKRPPPKLRKASERIDHDRPHEE